MVRGSRLRARGQSLLAVGIAVHALLVDIWKHLGEATRSLAFGSAWPYAARHYWAHPRGAPTLPVPVEGRHHSDHSVFGSARDGSAGDTGLVVPGAAEVVVASAAVEVGVVAMVALSAAVAPGVVAPLLIGAPRCCFSFYATRIAGSVVQTLARSVVGPGAAGAPHLAGAGQLDHIFATGIDRNPTDSIRRPALELKLVRRADLRVRVRARAGRCCSVAPLCV
mmetsp:Transcript_1897/g.5545  ORF Transcript_1897/g.5545 Transcript_1897/m.5545 type:complete len:223 (+) Transcript_1897:193-861(+)